MSYNKKDDEPLPFMDCEVCGESFSHDVLHNMMCEKCHDEHVDEENMELAKETFMTVVAQTVVEDAKKVGFLIGVLSEHILMNSDEDTLHTLAERIQKGTYDGV